MGVPTVPNCCIVFDLRVGAFIIGYLSLVGSLLATLMLLVLGVVVSSVVVDEEDSSRTEAKTMAMAIFIISLIICGFYVVISVLLVAGLHKKKPSFIRVFFYVGAITTVLSLISALASFASAPVGNVIGQIIMCLLNVYFLLVIRSRMLEIEDENRAQESGQPMGQQKPFVP